MIQKLRWSMFLGITSFVLQAGCSGAPPATAPRMEPAPTVATREGPEYPGARLVAGPRGELYQTLSEQGPVGLRLLFRRSSDFGATWQLPPTVRYETTEQGMTVTRPDIDIDGKGGIYLAWWRKQSGAKGIYFHRSRDGGRTWAGQPTSLVSTGSPFAPDLRADPEGHLYLLWQEEQKPTRHLLLTTSADSGSTWLKEPIRFTAHLPETGQVYTPQLTLGGHGRAYVVWHEAARRPPGWRRIAFNRSADFGATWLPEPVPIRSFSEPSGISNINPSIWADADGHLLLSWEELTPRGTNIFLVRSADGGVTWTQQPVQLNDPLPPRTLAKTVWFAGGGGGKVYAVWTERDEIRKRIAFRRSTDFGATWERQQYLDGDASPATSSDAPLIAADRQGHVFVTWQQWNSRHWRGWKVLLTRSEDSGATWLPKPIRLDTLPQSKFALRPLQLLTDGQRAVYVAWGGDPFGKQDHFFNRSLDGGTTWLPKESWLTDPSALQPPQAPAQGTARPGQ